MYVELDIYLYGEKNEKIIYYITFISCNFNECRLSLAEGDFYGSLDLTRADLDLGV